MRTYYVYILANQSRTLYIGITNDLQRRVHEHKMHAVPGFTARYAVNQLVYYEETTDAVTAIEREKQLKGWRREKKIKLIERRNPHWFDLSDRWYDERAVGEAEVRSPQHADPSTPASTPPLRMTSSQD